MCVKSRRWRLQSFKPKGQHKDSAPRHVEYCQIMYIYCWNSRFVKRTLFLPFPTGYETDLKPSIHLSPQGATLYNIAQVDMQESILQYELYIQGLQACASVARVRRIKCFQEFNQCHEARVYCQAVWTPTSTAIGWRRTMGALKDRLD